MVHIIQPFVTPIFIQVHHEIVAGLKYVHIVSRSGLRGKHVIWL